MTDTYLERNILKGACPSGCRHVGGHWGPSWGCAALPAGANHDSDVMLVLLESTIELRSQHFLQTQ
eukprot:6079382-Amphidinium_carterae.1